jgi:hypothetical protein
VPFTVTTVSVTDVVSGGEPGRSLDARQFGDANNTSDELASLLQSGKDYLLSLQPFHLAEGIAPACAVLGVAVWLVLRASWRRREKRAGRSPDAVSEARDRASAQENGARRFFITTNPVVVIVMGAIFLALAIAPLLFKRVSVGRLVVAVVVSGIATIVEGAGTLILQHRQKAPKSMRSSESGAEREV